jgi:two-component system KDP operon response regulator KdpE
MEASTGKEGFAWVIQHRPNVILLDLGLPDMDGLNFISCLREWSRIPVIVISARGKEADKVSALDSGADDFLSKPFSVQELQARMRAILRHTDPASSESPVFVLDHWRVNLAERQVLVDNEEVHLSPLEYALFSTLVRHAGMVVTYRQIMKEVWGDPTGTRMTNLRLYTNQFRHKLEKQPSHPKFLRTEAGMGYRL